MGAPPRYAKQRDRSEGSIVDALETIGASVHRLESESRSGVPDLLVGWNGLDGLLEVKNPEGERSRKANRNGIGKAQPTTLSEAQERWHSRWRGRPVATVRTPEEAVAAVRAWRLPGMSSVLRAQREEAIKAGAWNGPEETP